MQRGMGTTFFRQMLDGLPASPVDVSAQRALAAPARRFSGPRHGDKSLALLIHQKCEYNRVPSMSLCGHLAEVTGPGGSYAQTMLPLVSAFLLCPRPDCIIPASTL